MTSNNSIETTHSITFLVTIEFPEISEPFEVPVTAPLSEFLEMFEKYCMVAKNNNCLYFIDESYTRYRIYKMNDIDFSIMDMSDIKMAVNEFFQRNVDIPEGYVYVDKVH